MVNLLVGFAFAIDQIGTLYFRFACQAESVMLKQDFYLWIVQHTLLHNLGRTQVGLADNHIYFFAEPCQIRCFFAGSVAPAHYCYRLVAVEKAVARSARRYAAPFVVLFGLYAEELGTCACSDDDGIGFVLRTVLKIHSLGRAGEINTGNNALYEAGAEPLCLTAHIVHHLERFHAVGVTGEILHFGGDHQLSSHLRSFYEDRGEVGTRGIDGRGIARRTGTDDETRERLPRPPQRGGLQKGCIICFHIDL